MKVSFRAAALVGITVLFSVQAIAQDEKKTSSDIHSYRKGHANDEASCVIDLIKGVLGTTSIQERRNRSGNSYDYETVTNAQWSALQLEPTVYFSKTQVPLIGSHVPFSGGTTYTVYGTNPKFMPPDYKIEMQGTWGSGSDGLSGCELTGGFTITNSEGLKIANLDEHNQLWYLTSGQFEEQPSREVKVADSFNAERAYDPNWNTSEPKQSMRIVLDSDKLKDMFAKEGGAIVVETIAAKGLGFAKWTSKGFRVIKLGARGFLLLDRVGHVVSAYQVVTEGQEPKKVAITEIVNKETLKKMWGAGTSVLASTGVLKAPGAYVNDFDHMHNQSKPVATRSEPKPPVSDTHLSTPAPAPSSSNTRLRDLIDN